MYIAKSYKIKNVRALEVLDSRGHPTVKVKVETGFGIFWAIAPSGASKGKLEAIELRDGQKRYFGKGVLKAVRNVNEILAKKLKGKDSRKQKEIDDILIQLDGTKNKSRLGSNAICATSMAVCKAGAGLRPLFYHINEIFTQQTGIKAKTFNLPKVCFNIINGGVHAGNKLSIQEFMICPFKKKFSENLRIAVEVYYILKEILKKNFGKQAINVGDEGGFAPPLAKTKKALDLILKAVAESKAESFIKIFLDCAATQFFKGKFYFFEGKKLNAKKLQRFYENLIKKYPIVSLEDPFAENEFEDFRKLKEKLKGVMIFGDDLLVSNPERIKMAKNCCSGIILKINQIGTVSEAFESARLAREFGLKIMVSHRSGDTEDDFISDFSVGIFADFLKSGAPCRSERVVKYNRLLEIEEIL